MKKITLILTIIISLLLTSCSIDWNDEKDKKISELEKQIQNDTFEKNNQCIKYKEEINNEIKKRNLEMTFKTSEYSQVHEENIIEIFYSKKYNTCYAIIGLNSFSNDKWYTTISALNILNNTNTKLDDKEGFETLEYMYFDLEQKIQELKGE